MPLFPPKEAAYCSMLREQCDRKRLRSEGLEEEKEVSLRDFKSKLILLEFSGVACGPCQAAVPFLKKLREDYEESDLQIISLESWNANDETMKAYQEKKQLNYPFIRASEQVIEAYKTGGAAPRFFLIDEHRFVRKAFSGYSEGITDVEIKKAIEALF